MRFGPICPNCTEPVPFGRSQWKLGTVFQCARCDAALVYPRWTAAIWGGGGALIFGMLRHYVPQEAGSQIALFALMIAIILPLSWAMTKVRLANVG